MVRFTELYVRVKKMEDNRFFRFVTKFNSIVLMVAGLMAILILIISGYSIYKDIMRKREVRNIVNVTENTDVDEKWNLGYLRNVDGTPYVMIPLYSDQSYARSYYSKSSSSTRNYLFINSKTNDKNWLFDTNEYLIIDDDLLSEQEYGKDETETRAILYHVVKSDTNGDKKLTSDDLSNVLVSKPSGEGLKEILSGLDIFIGHRTLDEDTLLLVYQRKGVGYSSTLSMKNLELSNESELPKVGNPNH